jgi:hypothetical protein
MSRFAASIRLIVGAAVAGAHARRMRKFAGHAVLVIAAFASIATSRPRWHVEATPPSTQIDPALGTLAVLEASERPEDVQCVAAHDQLAALRTEVGTRYEFLCPPGTRFKRALVEGRGAQPPDDAFVRFVELRPVKMWRAEATRAFPVVTQEAIGGSSYTFAEAEVGGALIATVDVSLEPGADPMLRAPELISNGPSNFGIAIYASDTEPHRGSIAVHAVGYGLCEKDCTPGQITIWRAK